MATATARLHSIPSDPAERYRVRKALRRTRGELAAGGRCERAERLLSDQLDGPLGDRDSRLLGTHLGRCPRCRDHVRLLAEAQGALRAVPPKALEEVPPPSDPAPEPHGPRPVPIPLPEQPRPEPPPQPLPPAARAVAAAAAVACLIVALIVALSSID